MYLYSKLDKTMKFYIRPELTERNELVNQKKILEDENENPEFEFENYFNCKSEILKNSLMHFTPNLIRFLSFLFSAI